MRESKPALYNRSRRKDRPVMDIAWSDGIGAPYADSFLRPKEDLRGLDLPKTKPVEDEG